MAIELGPKRSAWVVMVEPPRPPIPDPMLGGKPTGSVLAVFPPQWGVDRLRPVVDAMVQLVDGFPSDTITYRKPSLVPYPAKVVGYGMEVEGGYNPYVVAFHVNDLQVATDTDTGLEEFRFTRIPAEEPEWFRLEREEGLR